MCGITGIFDISGSNEISRDLLHRMNETQFHRGPDEGGLHLEQGVGLGHRRLSIIDLSSGQQPLFNEDGSVVVVFNGEIYNFQELVPELEALGHTFRTHSDTEVIVHAWEAWGEACVARFRGMFAFALWDRNQETLFVVRDRFGVKPLVLRISRYRRVHFQLRTEGVDGASLSGARHRSAGRRGILCLRLCARATHHLQGRMQTAARLYAYPQARQGARAAQAVLGHAFYPGGGERRSQCDG